MKYRIAVLLTCHNRRAKTIECLNALFDSEIPENFTLDIFLVDDGSTDGTSEAIRTYFPNVNLIQGSGDLFWNQGMRLAWDSAIKTVDFDFYLWLNDDTLLDTDALVQLVDNYYEARQLNQKECIIVSACRSSKLSTKFSYGGRNEFGPVLPNGHLQPCQYINGNAVLISKYVHGKVGNLSNDYTHAMGDFDYGLRALAEGIQSYTTKNFIATCPPNPGIPNWCNPNTSIIKRWASFNSPLGLNIKEYTKFRKRFWKRAWFTYVIKAYVRMLNPRLYNKLN